MSKTQVDFAQLIMDVTGFDVESHAHSFKPFGSQRMPNSSRAHTIEVRVVRRCDCGALDVSIRFIPLPKREMVLVDVCREDTSTGKIRYIKLHSVRIRSSDLRLISRPWTDRSTIEAINRCVQKIRKKDAKAYPHLLFLIPRDESVIYPVSGLIDRTIHGCVKG